MSADKKDKNAKKPEPKKKDKARPEVGSLPSLVELGFSIASLLLLAVTVGVALLSYLSGATLYEIAVRTAIATLATGVLVCIFTRVLSTATLQSFSASLLRLEGDGNTPDDSSTRQVKA